jgi:hypothetical protein
MKELGQAAHFQDATNRCLGIDDAESGTRLGLVIAKAHQSGNAACVAEGDTAVNDQSVVGR